MLLGWASQWNSSGTASSSFVLGIWLAVEASCCEANSEYHLLLMCSTAFLYTILPTSHPVLSSSAGPLRRTPPLRSSDSGSGISDYFANKSHAR